MSATLTHLILRWSNSVTELLSRWRRAQAFSGLWWCFSSLSYINIKSCRDCYLSWTLHQQEIYRPPRPGLSFSRLSFLFGLSLCSFNIVKEREKKEWLEVIWYLNGKHSMKRFHILPVRVPHSEKPYFWWQHLNIHLHTLGHKSTELVNFHDVGMLHSFWMQLSAKMRKHNCGPKFRYTHHGHDDIKYIVLGLIIYLSHSFSTVELS